MNSGAVEEIRERRVRRENIVVNEDAILLRSLQLPDALLPPLWKLQSGYGILAGVSFDDVALLDSVQAGNKIPFWLHWNMIEFILSLQFWLLEK